MSKSTNVANIVTPGFVTVADDGTVFAGSDIAKGTSFEDAVKALAAAGALEDSDGWSDGELVQKEHLQGVCFLITEVNIRQSDEFESVNEETGKVGKAEYAFCRAITRDSNTWIKFSGGGTLARQLKAELAKRDGAPFGGLVVRGGLRKSEYTYVDPAGKRTAATSWYLNI